MRNKLEKYIKRKFGHSYGSDKAQDQRQELIQSTLERYDEELAAGATEQQAYDAAAASVGDMGELLSSMGLDRRRTGLKLGIAVAAFALAALGAVIAAYKLPNWRTAIAICAGVGLALLASGVIPLILGSRRRAGAIVRTTIGGAIVLLAAQLIAIGAFTSQHYRFDYTARLDEIESIEVCRITKRGFYDSAQELETLASPEREQWGAIISKLAETEYSDRAVRTRTEGDIVIKIVFSYGDDGRPYVLMSRLSPSWAEFTDGRLAILDRAMECSESDFNELLKLCGWEGER